MAASKRMFAIAAFLISAVCFSLGAQAGRAGRPNQPPAMFDESGDRARALDLVSVEI